MANLRILPDWDRIPESDATPEDVYLNRREILAQLGCAGLGLTALLSGTAAAATAPTAEKISGFWLKKWAELFPAPRNGKFTVDGPLTPDEIFSRYNNFYEFDPRDKSRVHELVDGFKVDPWSVEITGEVEKEGTYDVDDLIRMGSLEERLYHFRCVEAWSANVLWTGFPLRQLIERLGPTSDANYVRFVTVLRPEEMPGQKNPSYPWPYYEALTFGEATNELALLTFGMYGHPLSKQNGAPVRMILPWKFGFKSIKSIVRIDFVKKQPGTLWSDISREYGFYGNINPAFDHPRWSQASERFLNTGERIPTQLFNGYADYVGHLYDVNDRKYFF